MWRGARTLPARRSTLRFFLSMVEPRLARAGLGRRPAGRQRGAGLVTEAAKKNAKGALPLTVLYDGGCPLCRREVGVYRGLQPRQPDAPLCCADASDTRLPLPPGTTREQLLARFHMRGRARSPAQRRAGLLGVVGRPAWLALAGPGRSPAGCCLGDGARLQAFPALAADVATLGFSFGSAWAGTAEQLRRRLVTTLRISTPLPLWNTR